MQQSTYLLVHQIKPLIREEGSKSLAQIVVGILGECHLLDCWQLIVTRPDFFTWSTQVLQIKTPL